MTAQDNARIKHGQFGCKDCKDCSPLSDLGDEENATDYFCHKEKKYLTLMSKCPKGGELNERAA